MNNDDWSIVLVSKSQDSGNATPLPRNRAEESHVVKANSSIKSYNSHAKTCKVVPAWILTKVSISLFDYRMSMHDHCRKPFLLSVSHDIPSKELILGTLETCLFT